MSGPSLRHWVAAASALAVVASLAPPSAGQEPPPNRPDTPATPEGRARAPDAEAAMYLEKIAQARHGAYQARRLVVFMGSPPSNTVLDVSSTGDATFTRAERGEETVRLWRDERSGLVTDGDVVLADDAPPVVVVQADRVVDKFDVAIGEPSDHTGTSVVPLSLTRREDAKTVETIWVDPQTGVVYQRELFGPTGGLIGLATMLDMRWGAPGVVGSRLDAASAESVEHVESSDAPERMPFAYELVRSYRLTTAGRTTEHWVYSDGLHALSVFRRPGALRVPRGYADVPLDGGMAWEGPGPGTWMWEGDGSTWVVLAEEPALDAAELLGGFPLGQRSVWARLGSVWARGWHALTGLF